MWTFKNQPIKRKLALLSLVTCGSVVCLACGGLFIFESVAFRRNFERDLATLAQIIARNSTASLAFHDPAAAAEILTALAAKPVVDAARIHLADGSRFASYSATTPTQTEERNAQYLQPGLHRKGRYLVQAQPVVVDGRTLGTLELWADYEREAARLRQTYAGIVALVLIPALFGAAFLSVRLQRYISQPILRLTDIASTVARQKDYSVRAAKESSDEVGLLTDAFNEMLAQIHAQDAALKDSEIRYRLLFERNPMPLWVQQRDGPGFLAVNDAALRHYGYDRAEFLGMTLSDILCDSPTAQPGGIEHREQESARHRRRDGSIIEVELTSHALSFAGHPAQLVLSHDVTERKRAHAELTRLHSELLEKSRQAGMAEVATGVLHNVGNVLNSVNVSATLVTDRTKTSKVASVAKLSTLIQEHASDLGEFFKSDAKGQRIPGYLKTLAADLADEQKAVLEELQHLRKNIDHIKEIVAMQQSYAKVSGVAETIPIVDVVEDALRMSASALARHGLEVVRDYAVEPVMIVDRNKVLQILVNLIRNAQHACDDSARPDKQLKVCLRSAAERLLITVVDNGVGIPPENLTRIFNHGFTTRSDGHGFGLHSGALAAKELGGSLTVRSDGRGRGAAFTLELPFKLVPSA